MKPNLSLLSSIDLKLLQMFVTIARVGGFTPAQAELNIAQSTISSNMAALEKRLKMRLCNRGRTGFKLTREGEFVYAACQKLLTAVNQFEAELATAPGRIFGTLNFSVIDNIAGSPASALPLAIRRFKERSDDVRLNISVGTSDEIERAVLDRQQDIAIGVFPHHVPGLRYLPLFSERQGLYCGDMHPLFGTNHVTLAGIKEFSFVSRGYLPKQHPGFRKESTAYNMEAIALLILSGKYIGYLPVHYASPWVDAGAMQQLLADELIYDSQIEVAVSRSDHHSPLVAAFLQDLALEHPALALQMGKLPA